MIAKLISQNEDSIKVKKPMAFVRMQQSMGLMPWMATPEPDAELSIAVSYTHLTLPTTVSV